MWVCLCVFPSFSTFQYKLSIVHISYQFFNYYSSNSVNHLVSNETLRYRTICDRVSLCQCARWVLWIAVHIQNNIYNKHNGRFTCNYMQYFQCKTLTRLFLHSHSEIYTVRRTRSALAVAMPSSVCQCNLSSGQVRVSLSIYVRKRASCSVIIMSVDA